LNKKILVAVDGSKPSEHALNQAIEHSVKWNAELIIITVVPPLSAIAYMGPAPMYQAHYEKAARESSKKILDKASTKIKKQYPNIKVETRLKKGRPSDAIVETAREEDVDLIVMGSRGLGGITGWILGSTSRHVVETCTKPILIIK
jgi:nucleotide-binding universal stress UspA family protein